MRTIRNLTWFLLALVLTVWAGISSAQTTYPYPAEKKYFVYRAPTVPISDVRAVSTLNEACEQFLGLWGSRVEPKNGWVRINADSTASCYLRSYSPPNNVTQSFSSALYCTKGGRLSGLSCVFDPAYPEPEPDSCKAGERGDYTWKYEYDSFGGKPNDGSCDLDCDEVKECFTYPGSSTPNQIYCTYGCGKTGKPKSSGDGSDTAGAGKGPGAQRDDAPPKDAPPGGKCPKGTVQVGVNSDGVPRCVGTGSEPKNPPPTPPKTEQKDTQQNPDGSTTTTTTTTTSNGDGSTTTVVSKTTTGADGKSTTTETRDTTKNPTTGNGGKDDSKKDDEKYDLCKQNPHLTICKNSSVAGTCGQVSCDGDAIQCATLRAAAAMRCQQEQELVDLSKSPGLALGNQIAQGNDPMKGAIADALKGSEIDLSKPSLDASGFVSSAACLAPITMKVAGQSVTASFESVCQNIQPLRYAIMACAYILVYLLVSRSILQG